MLGYLSTDIICSEKRAVSYEEQIMSKDKYPSTFSPQMATIVFIILQIFFATRAVLKIGEYSRIFHSFSWGIFGHVTRLGQSRVSKKIWWIITVDIYLAVSQLRKYPPLATSTSIVVKYCLVVSRNFDRHTYEARLPLNLSNENNNNNKITTTIIILIINIRKQY